MRKNFLASLLPLPWHIRHETISRLFTSTPCNDTISSCEGREPSQLPRIREPWHFSNPLKQRTRLQSLSSVKISDNQLFQSNCATQVSMLVQD